MKARLKHLLMLRHRTQNDLAKHLKKTILTTYKYVKHPHQMKPDTLKLCDEFFDVPQGTTYSIAIGEMDYETIISVVNNQNPQQ